MAKFWCNFCGKGDDAVCQMIQAKGKDAHICNECIALAAKVIADKLAKQGASRFRLISN